MSGIVGIKAAKDKLRYHVTADMEARLRTIHVLRGPKEGAALTTSMEYAKSLGTLAGSFEENYTKIIKVGGDGRPGEAMLTAWYDTG